MTGPCAVCDEIEVIERGVDPGAVARLETGYVRLAPTQYHEGYTLFAAKRCVPELHDLEPAERTRFLAEMAAVSGAVFRAFSPRKLNYELLGNGCPHLHWHLLPRHANDPKPGGPVWEDLTFLKALWTGSARVEPDRARQLKERLLVELEHSGAAIERRF